jgi:diadenylate cyclase
MHYGIRWQSIVDFVVLSTVIYWLLNWARKTHVFRLLMGIGSLVLAGSLASRLELIVTAWILHVAAIAAVVLLVVVYYAEIRHALRHVDPLNRLLLPAPSEQVSDRVALAETAFALVVVRRGALIVLTGKDHLESMLTGGIPLGGAISREILEAIFSKVSPVHDGAVIIEDDRISRVGVFLPLTQRENLPSYYGTRHRAAIGLAERSDVKVIVVSEERGEVCLVEGMKVHTMENAAQLVRQIQNVDSSLSLSSSRHLYSSMFGNLGLKISALGIASLIWGVVFMAGTSVRTFTVPIEFENVPLGLEISEPANNVLDIQLRAAAQVFDLLDVSQLVVRVDLGGMSGGVHRIAVQPNNLNLPPGVHLERALPAVLRVLLNPRRPASAKNLNRDLSTTAAKS